jgi:hypothetical protein
MYPYEQNARTQKQQKVPWSSGHGTEKATRSHTSSAADLTDTSLAGAKRKQANVHETTQLRDHVFLLALERAFKRNEAKPTQVNRITPRRPQQ